MFDDISSNSQGWLLTFSSSLMCLAGCCIIYTDLIYAKLFPSLARRHKFQISTNGSFLVACLSVSSGSLIFTSLTKLLPQASDYLTSHRYLSQHPKSLNSILIACYLAGILIFAGINTVIHHFTSESIIHCAHGHEEDDSHSQSHGQKHDDHHGSSFSQSFLKSPDEETDIENFNTPVNHHTYNSINGNDNPSYNANYEEEEEEEDGCTKKTTSTTSNEHEQHQHYHQRHCPENNVHDNNEETPLLVAVKNPKITTAKGGNSNASNEEGPIQKIESQTGSIIRYDELQSFNALQYLKHPFSKKKSNLSLIAYSPKDKAAFGAGNIEGGLRNISPTNPSSAHRSLNSKSSAKDFVEDSSSLKDLMLVDSSRIHEHERHHNDHRHKSIATSVSKLFSIGIQTTLAISLHKFPEGFIYYATSQIDSSLSINIFLSLAIHNIAEGFSMALPLYLSMNSRFKAVLIAGGLGFFSQPFGALLAIQILPKDSKQIDQSQLDLIFGCLMSLTSGFLTIIGLQMLLSSVGFGGSHGFVLFWFIFGLTVINISGILTGSLL